MYAGIRMTLEKTKHISTSYIKIDVHYVMIAKIKSNEEKSKSSEFLNREPC
jgi:hypothetical protein